MVFSRGDGIPRNFIPQCKTALPGIFVSGSLTKIDGRLGFIPICQQCLRILVSIVGDDQPRINQERRDSDDSQRQELERWIKATTFVREEKIMAVTRLYDELGIRQRCEQRIAQYFDEAKVLLDKVAVASERKQELRDYTAKMMQRNY